MVALNGTANELGLNLELESSTVDRFGESWSLRWIRSIFTVSGSGPEL